LTEKALRYLLTMNSRSSGSERSRVLCVDGIMGMMRMEWLSRVFWWRELVECWLQVSNLHLIDLLFDSTNSSIFSQIPSWNAEFVNVERRVDKFVWDQTQSPPSTLNQTRHQSVKFWEISIDTKTRQVFHLCL
jgi:hypothetical protein